MFEPGEIYRFSYLWSWQKEKGEESGRRARPVCLVLRLPVPAGSLFLFPITTKRPEPEQAFLAIPKQELANSGLDGPCWIILGEYNRSEADDVYDFESIEPIGRFSKEFFHKVLFAIKAFSATRRITEIRRT